MFFIKDQRLRSEVVLHFPRCVMLVPRHTLMGLGLTIWETTAFWKGCPSPPNWKLLTRTAHVETPGQQSRSDQGWDKSDTTLSRKFHPRITRDTRLRCKFNGAQNLIRKSPF